MVRFGRNRRLGVGMVALAVILLAAGVCAFAFAASGTGGRHSQPAPRISLTAPRQAAPGGPVSVGGRAIGAVDGAVVRLQAWDEGWTILRRSPVVKGRYSMSVAMSAGRALELRAVLFVGRRPVATSPTRRIAPVPAAASSTPTSPGAEPPVGNGPAPVAEPPAATDPTTSPESPGGSPPSTPAPTSVYWGAWIGDQLTGHEAPWDMSAVADFAAATGKAPSLMEFSSPFAECSGGACASDPFPLTPMEDIRAYGAIPFFSWSSQSLPSQTNGPEYGLAAIAAGSQDHYIREFAEAAAAWGHPFFLRFDWEMNGNWFPWGAGANGNAPADYVAAWRHVHQIFAEAGATDVTWVWCPYVDPGGKLADLGQLYPGDEYVDWTCLDGYNWGPDAPSPRNWQSFSHLFGSTYRQITESLAPSKPLLVAETASSEHGGSKAEWIAQAFTALPEEFPRIQGLIWFDKVDDGMDWPLETSSEATSAFATAIGDPRYLGNEFGSLDTSPIPAP